MSKRLKFASIFVAAAAIVFLGLHSRDVLRVSSRTHILWEHKGLPGFYDRLSIGPEGNIYVLTAENHGDRLLLETLDRKGAVRWSKEGVLTAPAIDSEGRLYVYRFIPPERQKTFLEAFDASGNSLWRWWFPEGEPTNLAAPTIGPNGKLFLGGRYVRAFDRDGNVLWTFGQEGERYVYQRPLVHADKRLYVLRTQIDFRDTRGHVVILDENGTQLGDVDVFNRYATLIPIDLEDVAAVGMDLGASTAPPGVMIRPDGSSVMAGVDVGRIRMIGENRRYLVERNQDMTVVQGRGKKVCANTGTDHFAQWMLAADGTVYASNTELISISPSCWTSWRLTFKSGVVNIAMGGDGTIYALTSDGTLRAITETFSSGGPARSLWPTENHDSRNTNSVLETR